MALPFSFQFNPRWFPSLVRRFLFHAIIHNNNRQDCFFSSSSSFLPHIRRAHISIFFSIHRGSLVGFYCMSVISLWLLHASGYFHLLHSLDSHTHTDTLGRSLSNYERRAKRHCFTARASARAHCRFHEKETVCTFFVKNEENYKIGNRQKRVLVFACFAIIPLPIPIAIHYVCVCECLAKWKHEI